MPNRTSLSLIELLILEEKPLEKIKQLITQDPELLNAIDDSGYTLLLTAVSVENFGVTWWLVDQVGIDLNCTTAAGVTPLHLAIRRNNFKLTSILLSRGAKLLADINGITPFHEVRDVQSANLLYKYHRDFNTVDIVGHSPFYYALSSRDIGLIEFFSQNGAYLVQEQEQDWLNLLEEHQDDEAIQQLIFLAACRQCNKEILESLIELHPNLINSRDSDGNTPYLYAAMGGQKALAKWLFAKDYATTKEKNNIGYTAFLLAASYGQIAFAQWLLKKEYAKPEETDNAHWTAFLFAVANNQITFAKWLLEKNYANVTKEHLLFIKVWEINQICPTLPFIVMLVEHYFQHKNLDDLTTLINIIGKFSKNRSANLIPTFIEQINTRCTENNFSFALQIAKIAFKLKPNKFAKQALEIIELAIQKIFAEAPKEFDKEEQLEPIKSLIEEFKSFDIANPRILLYAANFYQRLGLWKKAYNTFETILALPVTENSGDSKKIASLEIAELILNGYIAVGDDSGIDMDDSTEIKNEDDEDARAQKIKLKQPLLITRAIQAYEYVVPFENTEEGGRLHNRVHNMLIGIDSAAEAPWSPNGISDAMKLTPEIKQLLSLRFWQKVFATEHTLKTAELFMDCWIVLTQQMHVAFQPEDDEATRIEKLRLARQQLITRAIQAYEYIALYKDTETGNQLIGRLHRIFSGNPEERNWVPEVIEQFGRYYADKAPNFSEYVWQKTRAERVHSPEETLENSAAINMGPK